MTVRFHRTQRGLRHTAVDPKDTQAHSHYSPAGRSYRMPPAIDDIAVLRICVRNGFSRDLAGMLVEDLRHVTERCRAGRRFPADDRRVAFHH